MVFHAVLLYRNCFSLTLNSLIQLILDNPWLIHC